MDIKQIVKKLLKKYKTRDPFELAEKLNIKVISWSLHTDIKGIYQYHKRNKYIYINNSLSDRERIIVLCHEIGHAVLHRKHNISFLEHNTFFVKNKFEVEANKFAAELLIDENTIEPWLLTEMSQDQLASFFEVPRELLFFKFDRKI